MIASRFAKLLVTAALVSAALPASAAPPNVIFILADDLGWTDLGCQGSKFYQTPNIDRLAAGGMRFTNGYSCGPNCAPTRAALMTGQYGPRTGTYTVGSIDRFEWQSRPLRPIDNVRELPLDRTTIAAALKQAGYATGMFGKWQLGNDAKHHPGQRGFDEAIVSEGKHFAFETRPPVEHPADEYLADFLTDRAIDFIRRHRAGPFFLYLPHYAVHGPHEAKAELIARFRDKPAAGGHHDPTYAAMIASLDESVGRIVATLDELEIADDTLVIFSSDNGGVGGYRRAGVNANAITDNAPLRGGKGMLHEGGIRVPYLFRWPGTVRAGAVCEAPINSVDLFPTLLELAGARAPEQPLDGTSYAKLLRGEADELERDAIYWHFPGYLGARGDSWRTTPVGVVRSGDWKLMEYFEDGRLELYNLREDAGETTNLAKQQAQRAGELQARLAAWRKSIGAKMPQPNESPQKGAKKVRRRDRVRATHEESPGKAGG
jgi:arylsulfatase A-like enzyme